MIQLILIIALIAVGTSEASQLHLKMTPDEVLNVFRTDHQNVPEYQVVPVIHKIHDGRDRKYPVHVMHVNAFDYDIKLYLEPADSILAGTHTPIWLAEGDESAPLGIQYTKVDYVDDDVSSLYQDPHNLAAFVVHHDKNGHAIFEGTIGDQLIMKAIPARLRDETPEVANINSSRSANHKNVRKTHHHIVYKQTKFKAKDKRSKNGLEMSGLDKSQRHKRDLQPPPIIHPQLLIMVDDEFYKTFSSYSSLKRYVVSFWNAVDLRFRILKDPQIRLNVAGIVIAKDPDALPYVQKHRFPDRRGNFVSDTGMLKEMAGWFYEEILRTNPQPRFDFDNNYDIVVLMTTLDMGDIREDGRRDRSSMGISFTECACTLNTVSKELESSAVVEDNIDYRGIIPAAHELGHLFGSNHDGDGNSKSCESMGYVMDMSFNSIRGNSFTWTTCSVNSMKKFFRSENAECLYNKPRRDEPLPRILPGRVLSLDDQCNRAFKTKACHHSVSFGEGHGIDHCAELQCMTSNSSNQCRGSRFPAAEGSYCGKNKFCINGKCIGRDSQRIELKLASNSPTSTTRQPWSWSSFLNHFKIG